MSEKQEKEPRRKRGDRWFLWIIFILFIVGLGIRSYGYITRTPGPSGDFRQDLPSSGQRQKTVPSTLTDQKTRQMYSGTDESAGNGDWLTGLAPYLTEGGLSFFIGFCIGYFLRVVAKTVIFVAGGLYVCLILLSHYGMITVDWGSIQHLLQQILLNTKTHVEGLRGILAVGIPSVTMGSLGIWRGLKKPSFR